MKNRRTKQKKVKPLLIIIVVILVAIIAFCLYKIVPYYLNNAKSKQTYQEISEEYTKTTNKKGKKTWYNVIDPDLKRLQKKYPDVIAWLHFDNQKDHPISYPIMYSGDDAAYLRHDINKVYSIAGSIFLEGRNNPDFSDPSSIVYGHLMNNDTMFGSLKKYKEDGHYKNNQYFTIFLADKAMHYHVFSYFVTNNTGDVYQIGFAPDDQFGEYLDMLTKNSMIDTEIKPTIDDKIVILSTCNRFHSRERLVVCGVMEETHSFK